MKKSGKGLSAQAARYLRVQHQTNMQLNKAMSAANAAIDQQAAELAAMRRILIAERAQVIYYTDKYCAALARTCVDVNPIQFIDLPEEQQTEYTKKAIHELAGDTELAPHGSQGAKLIVN